LKPISDEAWEALFRFKGSKEKYNEGNRKWLKQIEGINNVIFNTYNNRIIFLGAEQKKEDPIQKIKDYRKRVRNAAMLGPHAVLGT